MILSKGRPGETYNIGGECEKQNIKVVTAICEVLEEVYPVKDNLQARDLASGLRNYHDLLVFVNDCPGHDRRYAINCENTKNDLGWKQRHNFEEGLRQTIAWYLDNSTWVKSVKAATIKNGSIRIIRKENFERIRNPFHHRSSILVFASGVPF